MIKKALSLVLIAVAASCQATPPMPAGSLGTPYLDGSAASGTVAEQGSTVEIRIDTGTTMQTKAARKTVADIDHYHVKLVNVDTGVVLVEGDTTNLVNFFHKVPNGIYKVAVDALDASGNSVVQGGAQDSLNTVTVASPNVTYSDDASCLKVRLQLLNATGEDVGSKIIVEDGDEFTGTPELSPGGICPCPTPSPGSPVPIPSNPCAAEVPGTLITSGTTTYNGNYTGVDVFNAAHTGWWNSGTWGTAWVQRDFGGTFDVAGYRWKNMFSDPVYGPASSIVVKLRKPDGVWDTVENITNTNFVASGAYVTPNTPYARQLPAPVPATAIRIEMTGHGWFVAECVRVWSPALPQ
jgi:hypothetical protein